MRLSLPPCATTAGLLLMCAPAWAQDESSALREFKKAFRGKRATVSTVDAKRAALRAIREFDSPNVAKALIQAYRTLDGEAGPLEARRQGYLRDGGGSRLLRPVRADLQPIHNMQRELLVVLRGLEQPATIEHLVGAFLKPSRRHPFALRLALASCASALSDADLGLVTKGTRKGAEDRVLLCKALASVGRRAAASTPWVLAQLEHESPAVRVEAIRALGALCSPSSLVPLIDRLDVEKGRVRDLVAKTLQTLTGAKPGIGAQSWRLWLADVGKPFLTGEKPLRDSPVVRAEPPVQPKRGQRRGQRNGKGWGNGKGRGDNQRRNQPNASSQGTGSYFGIPQDGEAILYVFDNSNSMKAKMPGNAAETRMDRCRAELHKALDGLTPTKTFNLTCFANKLRWFQQKMLPATPANIKQAHAWVDRVELELETNTYDSLELAFLIAGRGAVDRHYPVVADTIFFLSDGAPTIKGIDGKRGLGRDSVPEILAAVQRWNPLGRVVIHSIGLGIRGGAGRRNKPGGQRPAGRNKNAQGNGPRAFLEQLAAQNGGRYVQPK